MRKIKKGCLNKKTKAQACLKELLKFGKTALHPSNSSKKEIFYQPLTLLGNQKGMG
jgi:hypothetical protein